jgi:serine/threonine-protein kinase
VNHSGPVPEPLRPLVIAGMAKEPEDRPIDGTSFVAALNAVASGAYGPDWEERGRSHLGEAALLLALLWPAGAAPATQGFSVERVNLSQASQESRHLRHLRHIWHLRHLRDLRHRRISPLKAALATAAAIAVGGAAGKISAESATQITVTSPPGSGTVDITVTTPSGTSPITTADRFTYIVLQ